MIVLCVFGLLNQYKGFCNLIEYMLQCLKIRIWHLEICKGWYFHKKKLKTKRKYKYTIEIIFYFFYKSNFHLRVWGLYLSTFIYVTACMPNSPQSNMHVVSPHADIWSYMRKSVKERDMHIKSKFYKLKLLEKLIVHSYYIR